MFADERSHKKKKKDRDRDKNRDKEKSHKSRYHSSSSSSSKLSTTISQNSSTSNDNSTRESSHNKVVSISNGASNGNSDIINNKPEKVMSSNDSTTSKSNLQTSNSLSPVPANCSESSNEHGEKQSASSHSLAAEMVNKDHSTSNKSVEEPDRLKDNDVGADVLVNNHQFPSTQPIEQDRNANTGTESNNQVVSPILSVNSLIKTERKVFVPSNSVPTLPSNGERKPTEGAGIVIKKDYLPSPAKIIKLEKTRDDVTRVLNYDLENNAQKQANSNETNGPRLEAPIKIEATVKTEIVDDALPAKQVADTTTPNNLMHISENKENTNHKVDTKHHKVKEESGTHARKYSKGEHTNHNTSDGGGERKSSSSSLHKDSSHHTSSSKTSSSSKSSSRRNSSSAGRECSRCYRRSKIRRSSVGIQCRRFGEPFKQMTPTSTPLKQTKTFACNMVDSLYSDLKYGRFFHVEVHTNGGASIVHMYQNEIDSLSESEMSELTEEFFRIVFSEDENGWAHHVMGIVHDAASYIPDLLEHMAENYSTLTVKAGVLGRSSDIETSTLTQYYEQVEKHYSHGTFRYGPLHQISLVGKVHEEVGGYFPDLLGRLEQSPFLKKVSLL